MRSILVQRPCVAIYSPLPLCRVKCTGVCRRGCQRPSAYHLSCTWAGKLCPHLVWLWDPLDGGGGNAVLEATSCSPCQCSAVPGSITFTCCVHGNQFDNTADSRWTINHNVLLENNGQKNIMMRLQMTLVRSSCNAGTTHLTVNLGSGDLVVGGCSRHRQRFIFGVLLLCVTLLYFWMHSMTFVVDALKNRTISSINPIKISNVSCSQTGSWEAINLSLTWMLQVVVLPGHQYHLVQRLRQESDKATPWLRHHHAPLLMLKGSP